MQELLTVKEYGIASRIEREEIPIGSELKKQIETINKYIEVMEMEAVEFHMKNRDESHLTYKKTLDFFRSNYRLQNTKHIIQYLIKFLDGLPDEERVEQLPQNPFLQFKEFVVFLVNQLKEADVVESIMREYKELGLLNESTHWYYTGIVKKSYEEIIKYISEAKSAVDKDYGRLFIALKKHSLFWFSIRRENIQRVRKSDQYIYRLSRILFDRIAKSV